METTSHQHEVVMHIIDSGSSGGCLPIAVELQTIL
jgi:hypothetical protein